MFDTRNANIAYYNSILRRFGRPPMKPDQVHYTQMHTVHASLERLFADDPGLLPEAEAFRRQMTYEPFIREMRLEPHLRDLLRQLRPRFKTAVATNRTDTMHRVLFQWDLEADFDLVVSAGDVARPKPYPDALEKVAGAFHAHPSEMLYIGDSELDQLAARAAGSVFVAFRNPALEADYHIESLDAVKAIAEGTSGGVCRCTDRPSAGVVRGP
jgi:HAD superfamily hydrolase (TIGR01509 family)